MQIRLTHLFFGAFFWSFVLYPSPVPGQPWIQMLVMPLFYFLMDYFLKDKKIELKLNQERVLFVSGLVAMVLIFYWPWLNASLSNDEPHHFERVLFLLKNAAQLLGQWEPLSETQGRSSMWNTLDPRLLLASDVWRVLSLCFIAVGFGLYKILRYLETKTGSFRTVSLIVLISLASYLGYFVQGWPDNHPPLRTLPMFITTSVLGLSGFSARFSLVLCLCFFATWLVETCLVNQSKFLKFVCAILIVFSPCVLYSSLVLESSLFGFIGWTLVLHFCIESIKHKDPEQLGNAILSICLFALFRFSVIFLSPLILMLMVYFILNRRTSVTYWLKYLPGLIIVIPFLWTLATFGNAVLKQGIDPLDQLGLIFTSGNSFGSVIFNHFPLWIFLFLALIAYALSKSTSYFWVLGFFPFSYIIFHYPLQEHNWGIGRYQAEFFASYLAIALIIFFQRTWTKKQSYFAGALGLVLVSSTVETLRNATVDTFIPTSQDQRIINSTCLPFEDSIRYLKLKEAGIHFSFLGGIPSEFESLLWVSGYNLVDSRQWFQFQSQVSLAANQGVPIEQMFEVLKNKGQKYLLIQAGTRREITARSPAMNLAIQAALNYEAQGKFLKYETEILGPLGGQLKLYRIL